MAKILSDGQNDLEDSFRTYKSKSKRNLILLLVSLVLAPFTGGISFVFFIIFGFMLASSSQKANTISAGLKGERKSSDLLEGLPDSYYVIPGPRIEVEGRESEMDHIILGPNGIFVMETKNHNGYIEGSESDRELAQHKVGRQGGKYSNHFYNPIKQVNTHVYRLSQLLKNNGYRYWVQGMVVFTNDKAEVDVDWVKTPVFHLSKHGANDVLDYIIRYEGQNNLKTQDIHQLANLINEAAVNGMDSRTYNQLLA